MFMACCNELFCVCVVHIFEFLRYQALYPPRAFVANLQRQLAHGARLHFISSSEVTS